MNLLRAGCGVALYLFCSLAAGEENKWVCVVGEADRWRCGHNEQKLEPSPLAEPETQAESIVLAVDSPYSKPRLPWRPTADDLSQARPPPRTKAQRPGATELDPALTALVRDARFVLRLVTVSRQEDVLAFVEDFDMHPGQVRYTRVIEDGNERFLIVYGGYANRKSARLAVTALPVTMRAIQPKPLAVKNLTNPLENLQKTGSDPLPQGPLVASSDTPGDSNPVSEEQPESDMLTLALAQAPSEEAEPPVTEQAEASTPEPEPMVSTAGGQASETEALAVQTPVSAQEADLSTPAIPDRPPFRTIDSSYFTLQLSSQRTEESAGRFIARHGLDRGRLHLVLIDEGAGARWLILYSQFPDIKTADESRYLIPSGIRSPWARRVSPLQQNMIRSK